MATTQRRISAIDITDIWYGDVETSGTYAVTASIADADAVLTLISKLTKVPNVHQDTWQYEESEGSFNTYKNQLNGRTYRTDKVTPGDETVRFTIGQYDFEVKKAFLGGEVIKKGTDVVGWKKGDPNTVNKVIVFKTVDDVFGVFTNAMVTSNHSNTDKAVGIAVTCTALDPVNNASVAPVYWFDALTATSA